MNKIKNQNIDKLSSLDKGQIIQPSVKKLIDKHIKKGMDKFEDIESTFKPMNELNGYLYHETEYSYPFNVDIVFEKYTSQNPSEAWNGKLLSFGLLVSKETKSVLYPGGNYEGAKAGQILYLNLNLFSGLVKLAVAHEIIEINYEKKQMVLSYIVGAESVGVQILDFIDNKDGTTKLKHITYYKGDSKFRSKYIYPYFHTKVVNDYHKNMSMVLRGN